MTPLQILAQQSAPMQAWLGWMFAVNLASAWFWRRTAARWALAAMVANVATMALLARLYGPGHHLSLPHVVFWTPLLAYLWLTQRRSVDGSAFGVWLALLFATDAVSLLLDWLTLVRWLLA